MNQQAPFFPNGVPGLPAGAGAAPFGAGAAYVPGMPPELASLVAAGRIEPLTRGSIGPGPGGGGGSDGEPGGRDRSSPFGERLLPVARWRAVWRDLRVLPLFPIEHNGACIWTASACCELERTCRCLVSRPISCLPFRCTYGELPRS